MSLNNTPSSNNLVLGLLGESLKRLSGDKRGGFDTLIILFVVAIMFVIATAPFKILLRKNIGTKALSVFDVILGSVFFGLWAFITWNIRQEYLDEVLNSGYEIYFFNQSVLLIITIVFGLMALITLIKGFIEEAKAGFKLTGKWAEDNFRGDSILFKKHIKNHSMILHVWKKAEPSFCFKWSFLLLLIHPLLGFPFIFASISFAVNEYYHVKYKWETIDTSNNGDSNEIGFVEGV